MLLYFILIILFSLFSLSILFKIFTLYAKRYVQKKFERYLLRSQKIILTRKMMKMQAWMTINNYADVFVMLQQEETALYKEDSAFCRLIHYYFLTHRVISFLKLWKLYRKQQAVSELFAMHEQNVNKWFGLYQQFEDHLDKIKVAYDVMQNTIIQSNDPQQPFLYNLKKQTKIEDLWDLIEQARLRNMVRETLFYTKIAIATIAKHHQTYFLKQFFAKVLFEQNNKLAYLKAINNEKLFTKDYTSVLYDLKLACHQASFVDFTHMQPAVHKLQQILLAINELEQQMFTNPLRLDQLPKPLALMVDNLQALHDYVTSSIFCRPLVAPLAKQLFAIVKNPVCWNNWLRYFKIIQNARSHHILQMTFDHQVQMRLFATIKPSAAKTFSQLHLVHQHIKTNTLQQMVFFYKLYATPSSKTNFSRTL